LPVLLKGPTGCGKTRFVEYMTWRLFRDSPERQSLATPLITVSCHEDLTATDLVGRYLLVNDQTDWIDGPLTRAARHGGIAYLDEIVEARKDTTVLIHALTDHRRILPIEKRGEIVDAHPDFLRFLARHFLQSRIPKCLEGSKDFHPSALRQPGIRLSRSCGGNEDHFPREWR